MQIPSFKTVRNAMIRIIIMGQRNVAFAVLSKQAGRQAGKQMKALFSPFIFFFHYYDDVYMSFQFRKLQVEMLQAL